MTLSWKQIITELRASLDELYGSDPVYPVLFGSQARGDAAAGFDTDFLVVLQGTAHAGEQVVRTDGVASSLFLRHDVVISCTFVSQGRYQTEKSPLLSKFRREGVPLWAPSGR